MPVFSGLRGRFLPLSIILIIPVLAITFCANQAKAASPDAASLWNDFNHYTLIARPDLAKASAQVLLKKVNKSQLLHIIESSDYADNYQNILVMAQKFKGLQDVAGKLQKEILAAQVARARDKGRIAKNIALLDQGRRAYVNAVTRLKGAGQFAAPQLLAALQDKNKKDLHPYIINAMKAIGRPLVLPLSVALPHLQSGTMEQIAQVLAAIDYPEALPVLSKLANDKKISSHTRKVLKIAFSHLLANSGKPLAGLNTAQLYVRAGQAAYMLGTTKKQPNSYDNQSHKAVVWIYNKTLGLIKVDVPAQIYGDVLAMRAAKNALEIKPDMNSALSLWIMANLRRQNNLGASQKDPTYGHNMKPAQFYAMMVGPARLKDVLSRALVDHDSKLALDAIDALQKTAGANALLNGKDNRHPLIISLSYPDKLVRFSAASTLADARPHKQFTGYKLVVPTLASAIRGSHSQFAVVLADSQQRRNDLSAWLHKLGYETIAGKTLGQVATAINQRPGIDLLVVDESISRISHIYQNTRSSYKLIAVPILALTSPPDETLLNSKFGNNSRVFSAATTDQKSFEKAVKSVLKDYSATSLSESKKTQLALDALNTLRNIAFSHAVYDITTAEPIIISAVSDKREKVAKQAANVLTLINNKKAQQALAKQAFNTKGALQIFMFSKLADSATHWGNKLTDKQINKLNDLVKNSKDQKLAIAAAKVHGALALPTSSAVKLLLKASGS